MKPKDKFGNIIYPRVFEKMQGYERILVGHGYREARSKANLFVKRDERGVVFFADMRGTEEVPIWEDTSPLLYAKLSQDWPRWKQTRALKQELETLTIARVSFYEEFEPDGLLFDIEDGYCVVCGKDFQDAGLYCSPRCAEAAIDLPQKRCRVCGRQIDIDKVVGHHLSYKQEIVIEVCRSCHLKIHRGAKLPHLKPLETHPVRGEDMLDGKEGNDGS